MNRSGAPIIYMSCGISGSGKSHFCNKFIKAGNTVELNLDNNRKALSGDISNQDVNKAAVDKMNSDMAKYLAGSYNVFLSNTNLSISGINAVAKKYPLNDVVVFLIRDSLDVQLCKDRVADDIASGVDRSNVPMDVIDKQAERFNKVVDGIKAGQLEDNVEVMWVENDLQLTRF